MKKAKINLKYFKPLINTAVKKGQRAYKDYIKQQTTDLKSFAKENKVKFGDVTQNITTKNELKKAVSEINNRVLQKQTKFSEIEVRPSFISEKEAKDYVKNREKRNEKTRAFAENKNRKYDDILSKNKISKKDIETGKVKLSRPNDTKTLKKLNEFENREQFLRKLERDRQAIKDFRPIGQYGADLRSNIETALNIQDVDIPEGSIVDFLINNLSDEELELFVSNAQFNVFYPEYSVDTQGNTILKEDELEGALKDLPDIERKYQEYKTHYGNEYLDLDKFI